MRRTRLLLMLLLWMPACGEAKPAPKPGGGKAARPGISRDDAKRAFGSLDPDTRETLKSDPKARELKKKVDGGELEPEEALQEYLGGGGQQGPSESAWDFLSVPYWWVYIPIGLAFIVVLGCLFDLAMRLTRGTPRWAIRKGVEYKHFVPKPMDPPPDPTPPPGPPAGSDTRMDQETDPRVLPDLPDEEREERPPDEGPASDEHPFAA